VVRCATLLALAEQEYVVTFGDIAIGAMRFLGSVREYGFDKSQRIITSGTGDREVRGVVDQFLGSKSGTCVHSGNTITTVIGFERFSVRGAHQYFLVPRGQVNTHTHTHVDTMTDRLCSEC
jgi:hypothetical protein